MAVYDRRRFLGHAVGATAGAAVVGFGGEAVERGTGGGSLVSGRIADGDLVDPRTLFGWVEEMSGLGPRFIGSRAHRRFLRQVEKRLESYGLTVRRHPVPFDRWEARSWSLEVIDRHGRGHEIPVASYRPYSGQTSRRGVSAGLVDVGAGQDADYQGEDVRGRIVVADYPVQRIPFGVVLPLVDHIHRPDQAWELAVEDYTRVWRTLPAGLDLETAGRHGAIAMIDILPLSPEQARGQFSPHQQPRAGLPALHLDRVQGRRLRELMRAGPVTATLVLDAESREDDTIDYLTAELPSSGALPGAVMVGTHTDGQNAIEENGVPAILALAEYFVRLPPSSRPRDIVFVFSPNHMSSHQHTPDLRTWLERNPRIRDRIVSALVPEHLGALGWAEDPVTGAYGPTGRSEPAVLGVGNSSALTRMVIDQVKRDDLDRTAVLRPYGDGLYGEATYPYRLGIPTVTLISGPTYLVQTAPDGHLGKLDPKLMHRQTAFLARLLSRMLASQAIAV